jgi:arginyl-tRNA synthetase
VRENFFQDSNLPEEEQKRRVQVIARAAYWYYVLATSAKKDMTFDKRAATATTGKTGPYILYTYARLRSILRKSSLEPEESSQYGYASERVLIGYLLRYPEVVEATTRELDPSILAQYLYELSELTNAYYHSSAIIGDTHEAAKLWVIQLVSHKLHSGLALLKIDTLEEM